MSGTCNIRGIIFACRQHKHFGDLRHWEEWCSEYLSSKLDCCLGPRMWTEDPPGIRSECHRQNANVWNATDLCLWGLVVGVLGLGRAFFVLVFWGNGVLSLAFCPEIDPPYPTQHTWVFCVFHTELIDNFLFYHTQTWVEAMVWCQPYISIWSISSFLQKMRE